ncbi:MAG TPA: D-alanyl-D-alanine carboxypeptidase [Clostridiales bacterium]|nr:D-alanyl-D-alanine carboxypeptidase [Eubacteriales bacterium]HBR31682.1 D-alanyl-D-alanine carboxypeptidase [Clostridiales bacterium]
MKKLFIIILVFILLPLSVSATEEYSLYPYEYAWEEYWYEEADEAATLTGDFNVKSAFLMEASTGKVLYSLNEEEHLPIASVTKIMSTVLVMEAIDSGKIKLEDMVVISEYAASMGGSQVYLEANEQMSVHELLKALIIVSANDATLALAEHIYGSEESFLIAMNERAKLLGMDNTNFVNTNGLPAENHYSSAEDVAIMTRELLKFPLVFEYSTIWMDTIRNGSFGLANTNKLIRFYKGANGMKTGFTDEAMFCLSGTAIRDGMQLISVVLGASTSQERFSTVKKMLDFGFANYSLVTPEKLSLEPVDIIKGVKETASIDYTPASLLLEKGTKSSIEQTAHIELSAEAPVLKGDTVGYIIYEIDGAEVARVPVIITEDVDKIGYFTILGRIIKSIFAFF